ncbi:MAG: type II toxin-antitoxin system RelE/ParE family toxin [Bauldia sp.]|nr:MAG: type II toxin-antitoxin system RelE/ParE family toxin [Bauldia sp.]
MPEVLISPEAEEDLSEIWIAIALENRRAADKLLGKIDAQIRRLAEFPESGSPRPDIAPSARMLVQGNFLILYEIDADNVTIVRVLHGARDLTRLF